MLHHAWSYCSLCHDLLDLKLNRVTIPEASADSAKPSGAGPAKSKSYDLPASDSFWAEHMGSAFQAVAADVDKELNDYRATMEQINAGSKLDTSTGEAGLADSTKALSATINQLPELQIKKGLIDAHMNIATELLNHIRARSIDSYCAIEEALMEGRSLSREDKATLPTLISDGGTADDRLRLFLLLQLHPSSSVPAAELSTFEAQLKEAGLDLKAASYLNEMRAFQSTVAQARPGAEAQASTAGGRVFSRMMQVADQVRAASAHLRHGPQAHDQPPAHALSPHPRSPCLPRTHTHTHAPSRLSRPPPRHPSPLRPPHRWAWAPTCARTAPPSPPRLPRACASCCPRRGSRPSRAP